MEFKGDRTTDALCSDIQSPSFLASFLPPSLLPFQVHSDFNRIMGTAFNGASNVVQQGGLAILDDEGMAEIQVMNEGRKKGGREGGWSRRRLCV